MAPAPDGDRRAAPAAHVLGVGAGIGRFEIDDVAEENFALVEFVAPDDDGLEGQRAFAQPGDHRFAAGLDALGDGDFALAREQFDRAHFAQIHSHRIVSALGRLLGFGLGRRLRRDLDQFAGLALLLFGLLAGFLFFLGFGFLGLDDVDAHLAHHRQHVLDLLGGDFLRRHDRIELFVGDIAALLGLLDHLLDGGVGEIEQRQRGIGGLGASFSGVSPSFCGAALILLATVLVPALLVAAMSISTNACPIPTRPRAFAPNNVPVPYGIRHAGRRVLPLCRRPTRKALKRTAKKGSAGSGHRPNRGLQSLRNSVKLRLTLRIARTTSLVPRRRGVQH